MTVSEVIEELQAYEDDQKVLIGFEVRDIVTGKFQCLNWYDISVVQDGDLLDGKDSDKETVGIFMGKYVEHNCNRIEG